MISFSSIKEAVVSIPANSETYLVLVALNLSNHGISYSLTVFELHRPYDDLKPVCYNSFPVPE